MRILLIGGGKSGKSTMAQRLAAALSGDAPRYYWATMTPHDDEDLARIPPPCGGPGRHGFYHRRAQLRSARRLTGTGQARYGAVRQRHCLSVGADVSRSRAGRRAQQIGYCGSCWISAVTSTILSLCATISGTAARTTGTGRKFMFGAWRISVKGWQRNLTWYVR